MNEKEVLLQLMSETGINRTTLSNLVGYSSKSAVTEILNRQGMRVDIFVKLLEGLGCELVVKYKDKEWYMTKAQEETVKPMVETDVSSDQKAVAEETVSTLNKADLDRLLATNDEPPKKPKNTRIGLTK